MTTTRIAARPGRNEPCHCGSGRKYKQCCLEKDEKEATAARAKTAAAAPSQASDESAVKAVRPKPKTEQPWKTGSSTRGFVPRQRTPRKVGGS